MTTELTKEIVEQLLAYDPETGELTWLVSRGGTRIGGRAGCRNNNGYLQVQVLGRRYLSHRLAFLLMTGGWPPEQIDHKDGVRDNNRWGNLRPATNTENKQNQKQAGRNNKVGLLGVCRQTNGKPWRAVIEVAGKARHVGSFNTPAEAHAAYMKAKRELHPAYIPNEEPSDD